MPHFTIVGIASANSATGVSPRNRYIGFISEEPPESWSASRWPSASSSCAKATPSSVVTPPRNPSETDTFAVSATASPTSSRTARATWRAEPGAAFERPAPAVLAAVEAGREEGRDQVAVRHVQLEDVEPGPHQDPRGVDVRPGHPGQVLLARRLDHLHRQRARHRAGGDRADAVGAAVGDRSGVADLAGDGGALVVHGGGQPREPGQRLLARRRSARRACGPPARWPGRPPSSARCRRGPEPGGSR